MENDRANQHPRVQAPRVGDDMSNLQLSKVFGQTNYCHEHGRHIPCEKCNDVLVDIGIQCDKNRIAALEAEVASLRAKAARWEHFKRSATWIDSRDDGIKWVIYYDMPRPAIFGPTAGIDEAADRAIKDEQS